MKPAPLDYATPASVEEACALLAEAGGGATLLAGGQTLMPLLALRMSQPFILIDLTRIPGLSGISRGADGWRIGPTTRQREVVDSTNLAEALPALSRAARHIGHHQTRNRGTVGGSIALGEPAAELPATAVALGAVIEVLSPRGTRRIAADEFYLGPYMSVLEPDEIITAIHFPDWPAGHIPLFREVTRRPGDFALTGHVGALVVEGGVITRAGLALFGMGPTPVKPRAAEAALIGQRPDRIDAEAIADLAINATAPFNDKHASAEYRRTVGRRILARALREALGQQEAA